MLWRSDLIGWKAEVCWQEKSSKASNGTPPGMNEEFGLITQAQLQHQVDGERTVEGTGTAEDANPSRHSPFGTEIGLWDHLVEHVSVNFKKQNSAIKTWQI